DFLDADYTFVNPILAKHYGIPAQSLAPGLRETGEGEGLLSHLAPPARGVGGEGSDQWIKVDDAHRYGRGGLLPMAVFLTKNSPRLRTSPVKRGYWVVRRLLGEHIPPPPPEVPELPKDEAKLGDQTLPQLLARHREHKACAGCHQRFDSLGLPFEGYGPVGERRTLDLGGRPVQATATYSDGNERTGLDGLRRYLSEKRQAEFVENLCRKLFAYALGRSPVPSDGPTIKAMQARLANDGYRMQNLLEAIVTSPQFLNKRGQGDERE